MAPRISICEPLNERFPSGRGDRSEASECRTRDAHKKRHTEHQHQHSFERHREHKRLHER